MAGMTMRLRISSWLIVMGVKSFLIGSPMGMAGFSCGYSTFFNPMAYTVPDIPSAAGACQRVVQFGFFRSAPLS
jgi:hypothetical protein